LTRSLLLSPCIRKRWRRRCASPDQVVEANDFLNAPLDELDGGGLVLNVRVENYPYPFPLLKNSSGLWYSDSAAAKKEFLARQVGDNELTSVDVLNVMVCTQSEYFTKAQAGSKIKQYARRFVSSEGKHDDLYWKAAEGDPFHGYFFRILIEQGGHAKGGARSTSSPTIRPAVSHSSSFPPNIAPPAWISFLLN
jgi:hypothetical protein